MIRLSLMLALSLSLTACFDVETEDEACTYSSKTEASQQEVIVQFLKPFAEVDPRVKQVGETLVYSENIKIQNAKTYPVQDYISRLNSITTDTESNETTFDFSKRVIGSEHSSKPGETNKSFLFKFKTLNEDDSEYTASSRTPFFRAPLTSLSTSENTNPIEKGCTDDLSADLTFHNLKTRQVEIDAPANFIKNGCPGLESCKLTTSEFEFKIVFRVGPNEVITQNHEVRMSPDVPFLGAEYMPTGYFISNDEGVIYNGLVSHCIEYWNEDNIYIRRCTFLTDFRYSD